MVLLDKDVQVHPSDRPIRMASFWQQLKALLWRNILLKKRNKGQLLQELLYPIYFVAILVIIKVTTKPGTKPSLTFPAHDIASSSFGRPFTSAKTIYVVPDTAEVKLWMDRVTAQLDGPPSYRQFATFEDAENDYVKNTKNIVAGIVFNVSGDTSSYAIRMNYNDMPDTDKLYNYDGGSCRSNSNGTGDSQCIVNNYLTSGFAQLQIAIENVLMENLGLATPNRTVQVQLMDKGEFNPSTSYIQTISSIYFVFSFSFLANFLAVNIVNEKEKKIKDGMMMMGLRSSVFWLSWAIIYALMIAATSCVMILIIVGAQFFERSNIFLLFLIFMLYGFSFMALAFMLTPFFNKAKVAGAVTGFSTVIVSCLYLAVSQTRDENSYDSNVPEAAQWLMCLLSPIAFATTIDQAIYLDVRMDGFGFDDSLTFGKFPLYAAILMLVVDIILYTILTVYFDRVIPGEYGVRYHPLFFLKPSFWCSGQQRGETRRLIGTNKSNSEVADVEPVPREMEGKVAMRVASLTKTFKTGGKMRNAVDAFSLDIYESQITCLLGHNGAGKTTLINMLTGLTTPTSGNATIMGLDVTNPSEIEQIHSLCGICPQHNILFDQLSCREHLEMFASIKGVPTHLIEETVESALKDVDLKSKAETFSKDLSGGQKRKLSVAIALIGDPKLIFLDEPTAGMDPYSRRHLWSLLKQKKEGRVVLLTTHFMDEADILADRKAFIRKGKLRCCGSSLFLKNKFGIGYHLNMVVTPDCQVFNVTSSLQSVIPNIEHQRSHGKELAYTIPREDVGLFSTLFTEIDHQSETLGIRSYGVSMTTLEEVFLKLEADEVIEEDDDTAEGRENEGFTTNDDVRLDLNTPVPGDRDFAKPSVLGSNLSKQRFFSLLKIRFLLVIRNGKSVFFQVVMPVIFVVVGLVIAKVNEAKPAGVPTPFPINPYVYVNSISGSSDTRLHPLLVFDGVGNTDSKAVISQFETQMVVSNYTAGQYNTSDVAPHNIGVQIESLTSQVLTDFVALYNDSAYHAIPVLINLVTQNMLAMANIPGNISGSSYPWPQTDLKLTYNAGAMTSALLVGLAFILSISGFASEVVQDRELKMRGQLRISGVNFNLYWGTIYLTNFAVYLIPSLLVLIIVLAMQIPGLSSGGAVVALVLLFITNIPFNIVMGLVLSFLFDKTETCLTYLPALLNIVAMVPYLAVSLVDMITQSDAAIVLHYLACVLDPPYMIFGGFYFISRMNLLAVILGRDVKTSDYFEFDNHFLITIIMPIVHFVWMYWLLRVLDIKKTGGQLKEAFPCCARSIDTSPAENTDVIEDEDEDVKAERTRIESLMTMEEKSYSPGHGLQQVDNQEPVAYMSKLRKVFIKRTKKGGMCKPGNQKLNIAVRNLSIGVDGGEVLGLLGPNGAGKSTALNMMIAETNPSGGKVVVSGHNIRSNMLSVLESLGYCPQHDALWDKITLKEHIQCFAAIKGISPKHLDDVSQFYISNLKLQEHEDKHSKKLSGGTKRKLSYILSILGSPHLVLLDEPSTGMDPQSKRFLWNTISSTFSNTDRGAILTTHYMEEADALCGRVGIMVNGQLECIGSTQHLKGKYGSGYILEVKLGTHVATNVEALMDSLERHLQSLFPGLEQVERFMERAQYAVPKEDVTSLGKTFASLEECKTSHGLEEYNFSQSSLEQVFLYFAKQQLEEGEDEAARQMKARKYSVNVMADNNGYQQEQPINGIRL